jgi:hypothetical protein
MKKYLLLLLPILFMACEKKNRAVQPIPIPVSPPQMQYTDLNNTPVRFGQWQMVNPDGDNITDLLFSTVLIGDPVLRRDRRQYFVSAGFDVFLLTDANEQTPLFNSGDKITIANTPGYNWFNASSVVLAEKIIEETGPDRWEGNWKNANHKYLAIQLKKGDLHYNGWVELSFKTDTEELVLHRAAMTTEPGKTITAGY